MSSIPKDPIPLWDNDLTKECAKRLFAENGVHIEYGQRAWLFEPGLRNRTIQLAAILRKIVGNSDAGRSLSVDDRLNAELLDILSAACYLFNSTSFRDSVYHDFDRQEVDRKLRRK